MTRALVIANFGGPRSLDEVETFLIALFTDRELFRIPALYLPFFRWLAKRRAPKVRAQYAAIGGKSPIYEDTEFIAAQLRARLAHISHIFSDNAHTLTPDLSHQSSEVVFAQHCPDSQFQTSEGQRVLEKCEKCAPDYSSIYTFHRYLPATHRDFFHQIECCHAEKIVVFPLFPQFTYATTGSIATLFSKRLSPAVQRRLYWIKSYPTHPAFVELFQRMIRSYFIDQKLREEESILLFSAHGLPQAFIDEGDPYEDECRASFSAIMRAFPQVLGRLSYQSKVGRARWLLPSTEELCRELPSWGKGRRHLIFVPLSFTSDHVETLYEIEQEYLPLVRERGWDGHRLPAPNRREDWIDAIERILGDEAWVTHAMLLT